MHFLMGSQVSEGSLVVGLESEERVWVNLKRDLSITLLISAVSQPWLRFRSIWGDFLSTHAWALSSRFWFSWLCTLLCCAQLCSTFCNPLDCNPPGSSVHGISQASILEWLVISSSKGSSWPRNRTCVSYVFCIADGFFTTEPPGKLFQLVMAKPK